MNAIRTPEYCFSNIPDYPFNPHYMHYKDLRVHYVDEGSEEPVVCLHGEPTWSYLYRHVIVNLSSKYRVVAPDFIGFGKSDKLVNSKDYSYHLHYHTIAALIEQLQLTDINLVVHDWGGLVGLGLLRDYADHIKRLIIMNTFLPLGKRLPTQLQAWKFFARLHPNLPVGTIMRLGSRYLRSGGKDIINAYKAPFPSRKYKGGVYAFPRLLPQSTDNQIIPFMKSAYTILQNWAKPALVLFSNSDIVYKRQDQFFAELIPSVGIQDHITLNNAGHFLQEDKREEIGILIRSFLQRT